MTNTLFKQWKKGFYKKNIYFFIDVVFCRQVYKYMTETYNENQNSSKNNNRKIYFDS